MQINVMQMGCHRSVLLIKPVGFLSRRHTFFFDNLSFHRLFSTIPVFSRGIQQFFALTEFLALSANTDVPPLPYLPAMTVCGFRGKHFG